MSELVADCPRCGASRITFNLLASSTFKKTSSWQKWYEAFCICRHCNLGTIFVLSEKGFQESQLLATHPMEKLGCVVNDLLHVESFVSKKDLNSVKPPEYLPKDIHEAFSEGATCLSVGCFNAAGTMFRLCIDLATKSLLPQEAEGLTSKIRRNLGLRLPWLFENDLLPKSLEDLSSCIKEDGNDGAHEGSLKKVDAEDLLDFTTTLLERLYTEPERLRLATERRAQRRQLAV